jgi:hypothetical protein
MSKELNQKRRPIRRTLIELFPGSLEAVITERIVDMPTPIDAAVFSAVPLDCKMFIRRGSLQE